MKQRLRVFVSSPGDVKAAREIAALTIERLAQEFTRFFTIEPYLWEFEVMLASGHFQDSLEPPSAFDVVVLILWSRLGTHLPEQTAVRQYRGIDGRAPITGTEWEFEEALQAARVRGAPDILVYRSLKPAPFDTHDARHFEEQSLQLRSLNGFWERHFANQGMFIGAFTLFANDTEFAEALEKHLRKLIAGKIAALTNERTASKAWAQAPFRGLESYEFEHAPIFFGQDEALAKAMLQLSANAESGAPFLLILGASGSGKSSLVKAGIVPKLFVPRRIPGVAFLRRVMFRPSDAREGEDLFDALARRLTTPLKEYEGLAEMLGHGQSVSALAALLRGSAGAALYPIETALGSLTEDARQAGRMLEHETAKLVLVVDQLEELFTSERIPADDKLRFVSLLNALSRSGKVWVIATMRKDFWHRADETPELVRMAERDGRLELLPPGPAQLSQMIRRPAEAAGIFFEVHETTNVPLNDAVAAQVAREPGALPLLSYLLDQLYRVDVLQSHGDTLTYATYDRLGKLEGAIATQAEAVLQRSTIDELAALGSVLFALIDMGSATGDIDRAIARRISLSIFKAGTPQRHLIDALLDPNARLLVSDTEEGGTPTVRVAHEALISHWSRAREFVQSNADALKIRHRIEERYVRWRGFNQDTGAARPRSRLTREQGLLKDVDLLDGGRLLAEHAADTEPHLIDYIERSRAENKRMRMRTVRSLVAVVIVVSILAILASAEGLIASRRQHEAEYQAGQARQAQARLLTQAAAARLKNGDPAAAGIILEVLTNPEFANGHTPAAFSVFQDVRAADAQIAVLAGHSDAVRSAVFSPDGKRIVSTSRDQTIRIWDAETGLQLAALPGHGVASGAEYSPDGAHLLYVSSGNTAHIADASSGSDLLVLKQGASMRYAVYSADGTRIVSPAPDNRAHIWDARTGALIGILKGHSDLVTRARFSPDGSRIITGSYDKTARIWDAKSFAQLALLSGHASGVFFVAYSPDGTRVATASADKTIRLWDAKTGAALLTLAGHGDIVNGVVFSPDGAQIASSSADGTARIWDARTGAALSVLSGHTDSVLTIAYSPTASRVVTASSDRTIRIWDAKNGLPLQTYSGHTDNVFTAVYSPDGAYVLTGASDNTARTFEASTGAPLAVFSGHDGLVQMAAYSPDGSRVLTASADETARVWDSTTAKQLMVLKGHHSTVNAAAYSPDASRIVTGSFDKAIRIWDATRGVLLRELRGHEGIVTTVAYSPDGSRIVSASSDKTARIWDANSGAQFNVLSGHSGTVECASYSFDGTRIVTASVDMTIRIWDARTGAPLTVLTGNREKANCAAFSPDGKYIVSSSDIAIRIWDAQSGSQLKSMSASGNGTDYAVYSPDGQSIVSAWDDNVARAWDARMPGDVPTQVFWYAAAQPEVLPDVERAELGLAKSFPDNLGSTPISDCDRAAGAFYDPDRVSSGMTPSGIQGEFAASACARDLAKQPHSARLVYQLGRALVAKGDLKGARQNFELALAQGYRAAGIDLARTLFIGATNSIETSRAVALDEKAWGGGVVIAAYELGRQYESGLPAEGQAQPDLVKAWSWYQKGADAGEPTAIARFGEREDREALQESDLAKRDSRLLQAFGYYSQAVIRAMRENWPDDASSVWRYRRATIARVLSRDDRMQQVAEVYRSVLENSAARPGSALPH